MAPRQSLQTLLEQLAPDAKVYFQEPPNTKMQFPCIIYKRSSIAMSHADNAPYSHKKRYSITVIDRDPDSEIPDKIAMLPTVSFDRNFVADNLNHDVFTLFF
jgi:hypothetical protein